MENIAFLTLLPWVLATVLLGKTALSLLGCKNLAGITQFTFSYWVGYALASLLSFTMATLGELTLSAVLTLGGLSLIGLFFKKLKSNPLTNIDRGHFLASLFILSCLLTLPAAMIAPVESSSLAYHFALPKVIAETATVTSTLDDFFMTGPLFSHSTSAAAYLVGGETLMMLHNWFMSVMAGLAAFTLAKKRVRTAPAWLFATVIFTLPALTYTSGTGILEPRLIGFVCLATFTLLHYARSENLRWLALGAFLLAACASTHVLGFFITAAFVSVLVMINKDFGWKKSLEHTAIFALVFATFLSPMYGWLFAQTGELLIPFVNNLGTPQHWSEIQQQYFIENSATAQNIMERTKTNMMFNYPLELTMKARDLGMAHLGLGPVFLMALVPALMMWLRRFPFFSWEKTVGTLELMVTLFVIFYGLWFFYGYSMEPKYLLAAFPLIALPAWVVGENLIARSSFAMRGTMIASVYVIIALQLGISVNMNQPAIAVFFKKDSIEDYITQTRPEMTVAEYLKSVMREGDKALYTEFGTMNYKLGQKGIYAPAVFQEKIPVAHGSTTDILNAALEENMTLWVTKGNVMNTDLDSTENAHKHLRKLVYYGCLKEDAYIEPKQGESFYVYRFVKKCSANQQKQQYISAAQ